MEKDSTLYSMSILNQIYSTNLYVPKNPYNLTLTCTAPLRYFIVVLLIVKGTPPHIRSAILDIPGQWKRSIGILIYWHVKEY